MSYTEIREETQFMFPRPISLEEAMDMVDFITEEGDFRGGVNFSGKYSTQKGGMEAGGRLEPTVEMNVHFYKLGDRIGLENYTFFRGVRPENTADLHQFDGLMVDLIAGYDERSDYPDPEFTGPKEVLGLAKQYFSKSD